MNASPLNEQCARNVTSKSSTSLQFGFVKNFGPHKPLSRPIRIKNFQQTNKQHKNRHASLLSLAAVEELTCVLRKAKYSLLALTLLPLCLWKRKIARNRVVAL